MNTPVSPSHVNPSGVSESKNKRSKMLDNYDEAIGTEPAHDLNVTHDHAQVAICTPVFINQYNIVKRIFEYLRFRDVLQVTKVSLEWAKIGRIVRKQRKNLPFTDSFHPYLPHYDLAFEYFNGHKVSDEAKQLVLSGRNGYHPFKPHSSSYKQKFPQLIGDAITVLHESFRTMYDEPQLIITFGTTSFDKHIIEELDSTQRKQSKERMKRILGSVYDRVPCITSFSCGLVTTLPNTFTSLEMEKGAFPCISYLSIPKVPGMGIRVFTVTKEQNRMLKGNKSVDECKKALGIDPEIEPNLKGIVLLHKATYRSSPLVSAILQYLQSNPKVALGGGVHESVLVSDQQDDIIIAGGMLIYGEERVRVASVALQDAKLSPSNLNKIQQLKSSLIPDGNSFAFAFACNGRGRHMHGHPHVESNLFNSNFPKTPLVGAFTLGEFCHEVVPANDNGLLPPPPEKINFEYTTVYLLVSYKHPDDNDILAQET